MLERTAPTFSRGEDPPGGHLNNSLSSTEQRAPSARGEKLDLSNPHSNLLLAHVVQKHIVIPLGS